MQVIRNERLSVAAAGSTILRTDRRRPEGAEADMDDMSA